MSAHPRAAGAPRAAADLRLLRAAVFAAVCVALAAIGHGYASGDALSPWVLGAGWLCVFAVAAQLAGRERTLPGIALLLLSGQLVLHTLFAVGPGHLTTGGGHRATAGAQRDLLAGHLLCGPHDGEGLGGHGAGHLLGTGAGGAGRSVTPHGLSPEQVIRSAGLTPHVHHAASAAPPSALGEALTSALPMLLGHIAAAALAGWVLRRGEAALWGLVRLTARIAEPSASPLRTALALVRALLNGRREPTAGLRGAAALDDGSRQPDSALLKHCVARRGPPAFTLAA